MKVVKDMTNEQLINLLYAYVTRVYSTPIGRVCDIEGLKYDVVQEIDRRMTENKE